MSHQFNFNFAPSSAGNINGGQTNGVQVTGGQMNNYDQLNINQSSGGPINEGHTTSRSSRGPRIGGHTTGEQGPLRRNRDQINAGLMITARDLEIEHSQKSENWDWVSDPRFTEVAVLLKVWFFHIKTSVSFLGLSANTQYGAYLIFQIMKDGIDQGLDANMTASVSVGGNQDKLYVCLKPTTKTPQPVGKPKEWADGWLELELGRFRCDNVTGDREAEIIITETNTNNKKAGLIVAGIEIRPI